MLGMGAGTFPNFSWIKLRGEVMMMMMMMKPNSKLCGDEIGFGRRIYHVG